MQAKSKLFIILHGSFMIGAWVCAASLGIMIARYYKQTWTSTRCCNLDQWFVWHRTLMMLVWCLTIAAFVLILLEIKGVSKTLNTNPHALIGFITVGLCFLQPFLALVRPAPSARYRGIFNWVHWLIGNCAQILGIVCIFYAVDLDKAQLPRPETDWLLVGFVGFHFLAHLLLAALSCCSESSSSKAGYPLAMRPIARNSGPYPDYEELKRDQVEQKLNCRLMIKLKKKLSFTAWLLCEDVCAGRVRPRQHHRHCRSDSSRGYGSYKVTMVLMIGGFVF